MSRSSAPSASVLTVGDGSISHSSLVKLDIRQEMLLFFAAARSGKLRVQLAVRPATSGPDRGINRAVLIRYVQGHSFPFINPDRVYRDPGPCWFVETPVLSHVTGLGAIGGSSS
mgnify:CR=1 FL=1